MTTWLALQLLQDPSGTVAARGIVGCTQLHDVKDIVSLGVQGFDAARGDSSCVIP